MKKFINTENRYITIITGILILVLWEMSVKILSVPKYIFPSPTLIVKSIIESVNVLLVHTISTLYTASVGFIAAIIFGIFLSGIMDFFKPLRKIIYPYIVISQTVPIIFIYPVIMIWFGIGDFTKIFVVALVCFFPISVNMTDGLEQTDGELVDLFRSMGANRKQIFLKVRFPSSLPSLFSGLKIAATYSIMGAVIAEWLGSQRGLGIFMMRSYKSFRIDNVFSAIIIVVILSLLVFEIVKFSEKVFIPWQKNNKRGNDI